MTNTGNTDLNEAERSLQDSFNCIHLGMIQLGQTWSRKPLGQSTLEGDVLHLVAQQLVVDVAPDRSLIHSKCLQCRLHPGRPEEVNAGPLLTSQCMTNTDMTSTDMTSTDMTNTDMTIWTNDDCKFHRGLMVPLLVIPLSNHEAYWTHRAGIHVYIDQSLLAGLYGQCHAGCLLFPRTFSLTPILGWVHLGARVNVILSTPASCILSP